MEYKQEFNQLCECVSQIRHTQKLIILVNKGFYDYLIESFETKFKSKVTKPCLMGIPLNIGLNIPKNRLWVLGLQ